MSGMSSVSVGETYFFRDQGQFDLLRLRLLPELIARRNKTRALRLWSAGCSTGEEVYSLAMLVDMLLPERDDWEILILGNDIDPTALEKARRGYFGPWSFRMMPPALQQRYFQKKGDKWVLGERIRRMVTFRPLDLIGGAFPGGELRDMDLILCRNVFIYFSADAVKAVADKLAASLSEGGYLLAGHTELIGHRVVNLQSRLFADGVVYQRVAPPPIPVKSPPPTVPIAPPSTQRAQHHAPPAPCAPPPAEPSLENLLGAAQALADRGDYDQAEQICRKMLTSAPLAAAPYFLMAQLAQLGGDFKRAEELLSKTLYLDSKHVAAYLELAALYERADNLPRAQTQRQAALDIVRTLPGDTAIEPYETTAAEMVQWLTR